MGSWARSHTVTATHLRCLTTYHTNMMTHAGAYVPPKGASGESCPSLAVVTYGVCTSGACDALQCFSAATNGVHAPGASSNSLVYAQGLPPPKTALLGMRPRRRHAAQGCDPWSKIPPTPDPWSVCTPHRVGWWSLPYSRDPSTYRALEVAPSSDQRMRPQLAPCKGYANAR